MENEKNGMTGILSHQYEKLGYVLLLTLLFLEKYFKTQWQNLTL